MPEVFPEVHFEVVFEYRLKKLGSEVRYYKLIRRIRSKDLEDKQRGHLCPLPLAQYSDKLSET
jgi:hypothetical protein